MTRYSADPRKRPLDDLHTNVHLTQEKTLIQGASAARKWYEGSLQYEAKLAALGPMFANDPAMQFCLQSSRRHLGDVESATKWYTEFVAKQPPGPWRDAAQAELWLTTRKGNPPKPVAVCRRSDSRPKLDGKFDDDCWSNVKPLVLKNATGESAGEYPTEVRFAYDRDYLYLAVTCKHPKGKHVAPVKDRKRDADLRAYDRVSLLLDLDRDYSTCFHFEIDQRGCACEDCWGDMTWNPKWFVAVQSDETSWSAEAAIPLMELSSDHVTVGKAWACNVSRILPGRGVQAFSLPADVEPRPEGMGLLMFYQEPKRTATVELPEVGMKKVP